MGQKVNPNSMRLQLTKNWHSRWFADKKDYRKFLLEDIQVRKMIDKLYKKRASIQVVDIERSASLVTVIIKTSKPGVVIGRGGAGVDELKKACQKIFGTETRITIEELKKSELYASLVAENIASQLERRINFRRASKSAAAATMRAGAKGVRIQVSGRLNGAEMARREKFSEGSVPLHTIRAEIDYALVEAHTPAGIIGVKVWINKGENLFK